MKINTITGIFFLVFFAHSIFAGEERSWMFLTALDSRSQFHWTIVELKDASVLNGQSNNGKIDLRTEISEKDLASFFEKKINLPIVVSDKLNERLPIAPFSIVRISLRDESKDLINALTASIAKRSNDSVVLSFLPSFTSVTNKKWANYVSYPRAVSIRSGINEEREKAVLIFSKKFAKVFDFDGEKYLELYGGDKSGEICNRWRQYLESQGHRGVTVNWLKESGVLLVRSVPRKIEYFGEGKDQKEDLSKDIAFSIGAVIETISFEETKRKK